MIDPEALGTLLRHVLESLDTAVAEFYVGQGLPDYRPRYSPTVRRLAAAGPTSIRGLAEAVGVTHSAASQTVAQMARAGFVRLEPGDDARQRMVHLTQRTREILPLIQSEWAATSAAVRRLDTELSTPLADVLNQTVAALERRPFGDRMRQEVPEVGAPERLTSSPEQHDYPESHD